MKNLDQAISLYQKTYPGGKADIFSITWRPYFLDYNNSSESIDKSELSKSKLAGMTEEQKAALTKRMERIGQSVGINFRWGGKIGNTRNAHRLMHLCRSEFSQAQKSLVTELFRAYHEQERDISCIEELKDIAAGCSLGRSAVGQMFNSDDGSDDVEKEADRYRSHAEGKGVPTYIIQGEHQLGGAQDVMDFMELFVKVKEADSLV